MDPYTAAMIEQMRLQAAAQQQQHEAMMQRLLEQQAGQTPIGPQRQWGGGCEG